MPVLYLIEYSDNYLGTYGSLWHFKRDGSPVLTLETLLMFP